MSQKWLPGPHPRVTPSDSKVTQKWLKNGVMSHFWVNFGLLWGRCARVTFESVLGHFGSFASFCVPWGGARARQICRTNCAPVCAKSQVLRSYSRGRVGKVVTNLSQTPKKGQKTGASRKWSNMSKIFWTLLDDFCFCPHEKDDSGVFWRGPFCGTLKLVAN